MAEHSTECDSWLVSSNYYSPTHSLSLPRSVNMMADLYNAPERDPGTGTATCGSSEAVMLAGLAFKMRWQQARRARGLDTDRPNLVMGSNAQICWEKFARYFEVEPRLVPVSEQSGLVLSPDAVKDYVDERTIGVVAILGSTYNGAYEDIAGISRALDKLAEEGGPDVEIHVDAASGGFVAPFVHADLPWDFRVPRVASINVSGHKYGLVYPGVGWVMWRDAGGLGWVAGAWVMGVCACEQAKHVRSVLSLRHSSRGPRIIHPFAWLIHYKHYKTPQNTTFRPPPSAPARQPGVPHALLGQRPAERHAQLLQAVLAHLSPGESG